LAGASCCATDADGRRAATADVVRQMVAEGLIDEHHVYGTINCDGVNATGEICGVTTTSGLAWKIPGRLGDSPILGAGLRSLVATLFLLAWCAVRGVRLFERDGSLGHGTLIALLFSGEFVFLYWGLVYITASRAPSPGSRSPSRASPIPRPSSSAPSPTRP
jgi:hypothetical protein